MITRIGPVKGLYLDLIAHDSSDAVKLTTLNDKNAARLGLVLVRALNDTAKVLAGIHLDITPSNVRFAHDVNSEVLGANPDELPPPHSPAEGKDVPPPSPAPRAARKASAPKGRAKAARSPRSTSRRRPASPGKRR